MITEYSLKHLNFFSLSVLKDTLKNLLMAIPFNNNTLIKVKPCL